MAIRVLPVAAPLVSLLFYSASVVAPGVTVNANCTLPSYSWTFNSVGQSPCMVAGYMIATCFGGSFGIDPIPSSDSGYTGENCECVCSTIGYSLLGACADCQGGQSFDWSSYIGVANCTSILPPSQFPHPVPLGIYVPYWAAIDITNENGFDPNTAYQAGDRPEYGPGTIFGPSGVSTLPPKPSFTGSSSDSEGGKSKNTGGIVGGVVAAIAAISIAAATIFYLRRRRRRATFAGNGASRPMSSNWTIAQSSSGSPKLYNPDDPTTFPGYQGDQRSPDILSASQVPSSSHVTSSGDTQTSLLHVRGYHGLPMPMA